jgi:hypothetical protein
MGNDLDALGNRRGLLGHRGGALGVLAIDQLDQLQRREAIEVFRRRVSRFSGQVFEHASILITVQ